MPVYVVFHRDIEDDKYVRGVFATRELAVGVTVMDEQRGGLVRRHADFDRSRESPCCFVEEYEIATETPYVLHGPEVPYALHQQAGGMLIPPHVEKTLMDIFKAWGPPRT